MRYFLSILFFICSIKGFAQYKGGSNDGTALATATNQNAIPNIYSGGINDGVALNVVTNQNPITNIYTGGINDGVALNVVTNQNPITNIYTGGINDGVALNVVTNQNPITNIYTGGINDGVALNVVTNQNPITNIYTGGINDGVAMSSVVNNNPLPAIYSGGINDGYAFTVALNQNLSVPLPVTLLYFTGAWADRTAVIDWETGIETNLDHFELERSDDGGNSFGFVASIMPNTPANGHQYRYYDTKAYNLPVDYFLYRLKAIDKNGGFKYSAIVRLAKDKKAPVIVAYPNPTSGHFTLTMSNTPNLNGYSYVVVSTDGKLMKKGIIQQNSTSFDLAAFPAGIYHLSVYKDRDLLQHFAIVLTH
jgi:hypothetical protein